MEYRKEGRATIRWKSNVRYAADAEDEPSIFFSLVKNIVRVFSRSILSIVYPSNGTRMNFRGHFSFFHPLMHSCLSRIWKTSRLFAFRGDLRGEISIFFFPSFRRGLYMGKNLSDFFKKTGKIVDSYIWRLQDIRMICRFLFSGFSGNKIVTLESKSIADISDVIGSKNFSMGGQKISNKRIRRYRVSNFFFLRSR